MVITIQPAITGNNITPVDQVVCENFALQLTGQRPTGGDGNTPKYEWQIKSGTNDWTTLSTEQNLRPELNPQGYGERFYRRYVTSGICESWSNEAKVRFDQQPSPAVITTNNRLGDDALKFIFTTDLYATTPIVGNGIWETVDSKLNIHNPTLPETNARNLQLGVNTISWIVSNGVCPSETASIRIEVRDIDIPSGFSPNGDGVNECFRIVGGENAVSSELLILDRYNKVVFESKSFNRGSSDLTDCRGWWDGRCSSGNELPSGTYFYQLILNGDKIYKGYVSLKR